jgi:hypothetical protein
MHDSSLDRELASGARRIGEVRSGWRPWKNAAYEVGAALRFAWVGRDAGKVDRLARGLSEAIRF